MSSSEVEEARAELRKPFLHTGSWYRMGGGGGGGGGGGATASMVTMEPRQSSIFGSVANLRESAVSIVFCVLIVALGPIQFGFTVIFLSLFIFLTF